MIDRRGAEVIYQVFNMINVISTEGRDLLMTLCRLGGFK